MGPSHIRNGENENEFKMPFLSFWALGQTVTVMIVMICSHLHILKTRWRLDTCFGPPHPLQSSRRRCSVPLVSCPNEATEISEPWNVDYIMTGSSMDLLWRILAALSIDCFKGSSSSRWVIITSRYFPPGLNIPRILQLRVCDSALIKPLLTSTGYNPWFIL